MPSVDLFRNEPTLRTFAAGETVFAAGDPVDVMYIVLEGRVELDLGKTQLEIVEPGGVFGEMALLDGHARSATAVTLEPTRVAAIDRKRFLYLVQNTPYFALEVMQTMAGRIRQMDHTLETFGG
ncbi:MAG TPA: Crp/Fnr family transcriptional regulator [Candidatus Acidoferrum sp.]|nr:Crp/Fnr family transcriptional regulator [Candidatus Acidoferrum sp.]